ncbi:DUF58 domain-containing protein [Granulosicoccaceae sp. 1_MG-2023]|nr:DUF58 domain-containing protein [Granulosicoccaceae sp. 1_MG-2023]
MSAVLPDHPSSPVSVSRDELLGLRRLASGLQRRRPLRSAAPQSGPQHSRALGRGLDFAELREYQPGDDIRQIDWNVTARTGKPHTKLYSLEREKPCFFVLDLRPAMAFGTRGVFKSVLAARLMAVLAWSAQLANDRVGGIVFSAQGHSEIRPQGGRRGLMQLFSAVLQHWPAPHSEAGQVQAGEAALRDVALRLGRLAHAGSTLWFISDFSGFDEAAKPAFAGLMPHNQLNTVLVADPLERRLPPPGRYRLAAGADSLTIDTRSAARRDAYRQRFEQRRAALSGFFLRGRHHYDTVWTDTDLPLQAEALLCGRPLTEREA